MRGCMAVFLSFLAVCCPTAEHEAIAQGVDTVVVVENPEAVVYAYGHRLESPFVLEVASDTLWLNGYPVSPVKRFPRPPSGDAEPESPDEAERRELRRRAWELTLEACRRDSTLWAAGVPYREIVRRSAEFWLSQDIVDSVQVSDSDCCAAVMVYYKCKTCRHQPWRVGHTVRKDWTPVKLPTKRESRIAALLGLKQQIEAGWAILIGDGYHDLAGGERKATVDRIWQTGIRDTLWARDHARAANDLLLPRPIVPRGGGER